MTRPAVSLLLALIMPLPIAARETASPDEPGFDWSEAAQREFAHKRLDPAQWNLAMLQNDLERHATYPPTDGCMPYIPAPTVPYVSQGSLTFEKTRVGEATVLVGSFDWARFGFNADLCGERPSRNYCNVAVLMSDPLTSNRSGSMSSRSYPHIQAWGFVETCIGDVAWNFTGFATGANFLNINHHIFDLNFGRTVLVAPQRDGSLRFMQLESPDRSPGDGTPGLSEFMGDLSKRDDVLAFFNSDSAVDTETPEMPRLLRRREQTRELLRALDDRARIHGHVAGLDEAGREAIADFVAQEDVRVRTIVLHSIDRYGYPSPSRFGADVDPILPLLSAPPMGANHDEIREHLILVHHSLMGVLRENVETARNHTAFGLDYEPDLSSRAFADFYDTFLVEQLGSLPLYGTPREGGELPHIKSLDETNTARSEIGLPPLGAHEVRAEG